MDIIIIINTYIQYKQFTHHCLMLSSFTWIEHNGNSDD